MRHAAPDQRDATLAGLSQGLAAALKKDPRYTQVLNGSFDLGALDTGLLPYRYLLSPTLDTQPLDEAYLADQLQQRLDDLSSPAASAAEGPAAARSHAGGAEAGQRWSPPKSPEVRDGVWFSPQDEALLLVQTQAAGFDPDAQQQRDRRHPRGFRRAAGQRRRHTRRSAARAISA